MPGCTVSYPAMPSSLYPQLPQLGSPLSKSERESGQLINAVKNYDERELDSLLRRGFNPNSQSADGETALHIAAKQDNAHVLVELLLSRGANPNIRTLSRNFTPVHYACLHDQAANLRVLLSYDGDMYLKSSDGLTAMGYAQYMRPNVLAVLREHINRGRPSAVDRSASAAEYHSCLDSPLPYARVPDEEYEVYAAREGTSRSRSKQRSRNMQRKSSSSRSTSRSLSRSLPDTCSDSSDSDDEGFSRRRRRVAFRSPNQRFWTSAEDICASVEKLSVSGDAQVPRQARSSEHLRIQTEAIIHPEPKPTRRSLPDIALDTPTSPDVTLDELVELGKLADKELRQELKKYGFQPGPIQDSSTRIAYMKKLVLLKRDADLNLAVSLSKYSLEEFGEEMSAVIHGSYHKERMRELEHIFLESFPREGGVGRMGVFQYGNYLLLDPQITRNLPYQVAESSRPNLDLCFRLFLRGVFYIGKMKSLERPKEHLRLAKRQIDQRGNRLDTEKLCRIRSIWNNSYGVVMLNCFPFISEKEALTREALMIEALGLNKLTNERGGNLHGPVKHWSTHERRLLGSYFLRNAFEVLLEKGERQTFRDEV
ncbi:ankyrin repeat and LEM domain-containing protein 1-like [Paramacrobiotus metropolitanus]|uniref:ankyrin repeat and LEM domain-containing protein 1-like n=1 Tax=Paramacrobiotus metropolitanus TaxID=2943436 RepID=UPI002445904E|nr:ankyrin repeat and LEM domain-containing protein 1-like [Paramacrobiotus metropolitanus]